MKTYAVLDENSIVTNVIVADSLSVAEHVSKSTCVLVTEETKNAFIGLSYSEGIFEQMPAGEIVVVENEPPLLGPL